MASIIACENINREFTKKRGEVFTALHDISLTMDKGQFVSIVGPSGSGKSTLLAIMAGLDSPTSGRVLFDNADINAWPDQKRAEWRRNQIGFVFQTWELIPTLTAMENICMPLLPAATGRGAARRQASLLLRRMGLADKAHDFPLKLSGGEQQRIALARALVASPQVVFADEPTGNIDGETGKAILALLKEQAENGTTVVLVTHDEKIAGSADRVVSLQGGRLGGGHDG